eukprot:7220463-Prymnesium_polylepis.1
MAGDGWGWLGKVGDGGGWPEVRPRGARPPAGRTHHPAPLRARPRDPGRAPTPTQAGRRGKVEDGWVCVCGIWDLRDGPGE